jgi:DNA segregation ATPase FtsK/SpoIIIE, S-DNA-T family
MRPGQYSLWVDPAPLEVERPRLRRVWPDSFTRTVLRQVRSEWRRAVVYAWPWRRVMLFTDLTKHTGHAQRRVIHYPTLRRVRADGWRDRVSVKLLHGQCAATYVAHAQELANSFGARSCRVRVDRPRRIWLDLIHTDPLAQPLAVPALVDPGAGVNLARVVIGRTETSRAWVLRLLGRHILVAGVSDAGKSSVMWAVLRALAPGIRTGLVQVFGIDPKGGMELGRAEGLFQALVCTNGATLWSCWNTSPY